MEKKWKKTKAGTYINKKKPNKFTNPFCTVLMRMSVSLISTFCRKHLSPEESSGVFCWLLSCCQFSDVRAKIKEEVCLCWEISFLACAGGRVQFLFL